MTITIPSGRTLPLQAKSGGGFASNGLPSGELPASVTVTGSGFGAAPNVVLWRTLKEGVDGQPIQATPPSGEIGTFTDISSGAKYRSFGGRMTFEGRSSTDGDGGQRMSFLAPVNFSRFRNHIALAVPDTGWFPGTNDIGFRTLPSDSSWKPVWLLNGADGNLTGISKPDLCLPTYIGNGVFSVEGNSVKFEFMRFIANATASEWRWNDFNAFDYMQIADVNNPHDSLGRMEARVIAGTGNTVEVKDSLSAFNGPDGTINDSNAFYDRINYNTYYRTSGGNAEMVFSDFYLSVESSPGANDFRQCAYLGDNADFSLCTQLRPVVADAWSDTSVTVTDIHSLGYYHIVKPDGSVVSGSVS